MGSQGRCSLRTISYITKVSVCMVNNKVSFISARWTQREKDGEGGRKTEREEERQRGRKKDREGGRKTEREEERRRERKRERGGDKLYTMIINKKSDCPAINNCLWFHSAQNCFALSANSSINANTMCCISYTDESTLAQRCACNSIQPTVVRVCVCVCVYVCVYLCTLCVQLCFIVSKCHTRLCLKERSHLHISFSGSNHFIHHNTKGRIDSIALLVH